MNIKNTIITVEVAKQLFSLEEDNLAPLEKIYQQYSQSLNCIGIFSNGEAIYEKA